MTVSWPERVQTYIDRLELAANGISELLESCRVDTETVNTPKVQATMQLLTQQLSELEQLVAEREGLLDADDAPGHGHTLAEKLQAASGHHDPLAKRCQQVSHLVADVNHRAVSLFVCQFHLAEFGKQLIRLVAGEQTTETYTADGEVSKPGPGGGLLDEA
ncbi:MAG: hypothetical protein AAGI63_14770, partial [Planctomycetota bacterium]